MIARGIHKVDYKTMRRWARPKLVKHLPPGTWLPVTIAAELLDCSPQTVHLLRLTKQIPAIRFKKGPMLVEVAELLALESKPGPKPKKRNRPAKKPA